MDSFDNTAFTEKVAALYAQHLTEGLPNVQFQVVQNGATDWARVDVLEMLVELTDAPRTIVLNDYRRKDGSLDEETAANNLASVLSEPIIAHAEKEGGSGKLWLFHETLWEPFTMGCALVHIATPTGIHFLGQTWYDANVLKTKYLAKAVWLLARSKKG